MDGKPMMVPEAQQQQSAEMPSAGGVAKDAATNEAIYRAGRIGGGLGGLGGSIGGGLGGLRRNKKTPTDQAKPAEGDSTSTKMVPATTIELTMEVTSMSTAAADASTFEVPAGFKLVEAEMKKMLR